MPPVVDSTNGENDPCSTSNAQTRRLKHNTANARHYSLCKRPLGEKTVYESGKGSVWLGLRNLAKYCTAGNFRQEFNFVAFVKEIF